MENLYRSLTIDERYNVLKASTIKGNNSSLLRWRQNMSIISEQTFNESLKVKGYKKTLFSHTVDYNPPEELREKYTDKAKESEWYEFFTEGMELVTHNDTSHDSFLYLLRPFLKRASVLLNQFFIEERYSSLLSDSGKKEVFSYLETELSDIAYRAFVLELNMERERGKLKGETSEKRYIDFIKSYSSKKKLYEFYDKYIVLTRILSIRTQFFLRNIKEMIRNIESDSEDIKTTFKIHQIKVNSIKLGEGDTHQQGKTVTILELENGHRLVYKPKNLYINHAYNGFINWLNSLNNPIYKKLKTLPTLTKTNHSYEQFIEYKSCNNMDEINSFYQRFGQLMAIIQILNGTDIHMENLIAHGEHPIIVDLETMIQRQNPIVGEDEELSLKEIRKQTFRHVTRTLFLPTNGVKLVNLDLSAINGRDRKLDYKVLQPVNKGTDRIKYDYLDYKMEGSNNLPFLEDDSVVIDYKLFKENIIIGFKTIYNMVIDNKESLSDIIKEFRSLRVRVLFRDTDQYATILTHMQHPEMLTEMLDREKALENMWAYPYSNKKVVEMEVRDMMNNDIPIFFNVTNKKDIEGTLNHNIIDFYDYTPYEFLMETIDEISFEELEKQLSIISLGFGDFTTSKRDFNKSLFKVPETLLNIQGMVNKNDFLQEAIKIADRIMEKAINIDTVNWIIPYNTEENAWSLIPMDNDFYNGISGMYLYFYQMYQATNDHKYKEFYQKLLKQCNPQLNQDYKLGLSGYPGFLHAFSFIKDFGEDKIKIHKYINKYLERIDEIIEGNQEAIQEYDVINGVAGLINSLVRLYKNNSISRYLEVAIKCVDLIIENYRIENDYSFGHGNLGIGISIMELAKLTKIKSHEKYALKLIQSKELIIEQFDNKMHWCTGAFGAVNGMRRLNEIWKNEELENKTEIIISELQKESLLINDSLCHGNMGLIELLLSSSESRDVEMALKVGLTVKKLKDKNNCFKLMDTKKHPDVTLFTGMAGIGYQFLRLFNSEKVPSLLI